MNANQSSSSSRWLLVSLVTVLPLLLLFRAVLSPNSVSFSNDGTLGHLISQGELAHTTFTGLWRPLNWLGEAAPCSQPSFTLGLFVALRSAVAFSKLYAPLALLFLGLSAAFFCRQAGLRPVVSALVGVAAALNSNALSYACWGLPPKALTEGFALIAMGLLLKASITEGWRCYVRTLLAGFSVGYCVMEGADVGAIFSLYVAAHFGWLAVSAGGGARSMVRRLSLIALVVVCAGWVAAHALSTLIGTQIVGVAGMSQKEETKAQRWEFATWGSYPKLETIRFAVPGIFGYRMDTPGGGAYWGSFGPGTPKGRFSGSGEYVGVLVLLVASYGVATSLRRDQSPFSTGEQKQVWFWTAVAVGSLLLAFGKFAPFYQLFFSLPYFSTIRLPAKFLHGMNLAVWILFAYGLEALARRHLDEGKARLGSLKEQIATWRTGAPAGERRWLFGAVALLGAAVFAAAVYSSSAGALTAYLGKIEFDMSEPATAAFSIREVWLALAFLVASVAVVGGIVIGWFGGRAQTVWWLLGGILVVDLYRANTPWVKHYDYVTRYQSNPVIDLLKDKPWDQRVTAFLDPRRAAPLVGGEAAGSWVFLQKEWLEHHFQYFKIQSLDIDQMPRMPELEAAYFGALSLMANPNNPALVGRLWQLTNTRHVLGSKDIVDQLNQMLDPVQKRLRVKMPFALGLKPGAKAPEPTTPIADVVQLLTATPSEQGPYAVMEFTGALPRAKLYSDWQTGLSDSNTLETLRSPSFDPAQKVLLAQPVEGIVPATNAPPGDASIIGHAPKQVVVKTKSTAAGVLLLNDRWHPDWKVTVDGQSAPLLRANFIMRGVVVPAGEHTVEFRFEPPHGTLWISLSAIVAGLVLVGLLVVVPEPKSAE
jgi:hypothetical protein